MNRDTRNQRALNLAHRLEGGVRGDLEKYIDARFALAYHRQLVEFGYWCPRCDVQALPIEREALAGVTPGWCPFCGLDPRADGPAQPMHPRGIISLMEEA